MSPAVCVRERGRECVLVGEKDGERERHKESVCVCDIVRSTLKPAKGRGQRHVRPLFLVNLPGLVNRGGFQSTGGAFSQPEKAPLNRGGFQAPAARPLPTIQDVREKWHGDPTARERVLCRQPTGPNPLNHRDDWSGAALRHESLNSLFQVASCLPSSWRTSLRGSLTAHFARITRVDNVAEMRQRPLG